MNMSNILKYLEFISYYQIITLFMVFSVTYYLELAMFWLFTIDFNKGQIGFWNTTAHCHLYLVNTNINSNNW